MPMDVNSTEAAEWSDLMCRNSALEHRVKLLEAAVVGINIAIVRDEHSDAAAKLAIEVRRELQF